MVVDNLYNTSPVLFLICVKLTLCFLAQYSVAIRINVNLGRACFKPFVPKLLVREEQNMSNIFSSYFEVLQELFCHPFRDLITCINPTYEKLSFDKK